MRERYADFAPTLASEKLAAAHDLSVSRETLRKRMVEDGLWRPKGHRQAQRRQSRPRRPRAGELMHMGGSPH